jgi:hypothetical protein
MQYSEGENRFNPPTEKQSTQRKPCSVLLIAASPLCLCCEWFFSSSRTNADFRVLFTFFESLWNSAVHLNLRYEVMVLQW